MMAQSKELPIKLIDNKIVHKNPQAYVTASLALRCIVESWRQSLFSFEWLDENGQVRANKDLEDTQKSKYDSIYAAYKTGIPMERPVLGVGVMENIEIGSRKDVLLTLYSLGIEKLDVHIPKSCICDFEKFMLDCPDEVFKI